MSLYHGTVTMNGAAQRLSTALGLPDNTPVRYISLQPYGSNAALIYVGGPGVSSTSYGWRLEIPQSTVPPAPWWVDDITGPSLFIGDFYINGANAEKLAIAYVPLV